MNKHEKYIARLFFQLKVHQSDGQAFENLFLNVMCKSNTNFQPVKAHGRIGDMKNDGFDKILGKYYQIYGPEEIEKKATIDNAVTKLNKDFYGLKEKWHSSCPIKEFYYVVNDKYKGCPAPIHQELIKLEKDNLNIKFNVFSAHHLEDLFLKLSEEDITGVIGLIPDMEVDFLDYNDLNEVISFILNLETDISFEPKLELPDFEEKIKFNRLSDRIGIWLTSSSYQIGDLEQYFQVNGENISNDLNTKFKDLYDKSKGIIPDDTEYCEDKRFLYILQQACPNNKKVVRDAVLILMAYYFESCDIFEKPEEVLKDDITSKTR
ncbi:hypothetical protein bcgnr5369_54230 [Bacillus cereus]|uniref:ABC-three component system protein n=1 Tax=Bacillus cereus TaxID=1396 RepID=UPI002AC01D70|nr:ABC-three component system protein [Bacillus cereus]MDZ4594081.1 hypothetical protein [Bacillus cereus]HDR7771504.1 hypothetical protein [Bacillus paranthracis]